MNRTPEGGVSLLEYSRPCRQGPRAAHDSGSRQASSIRVVVIHTAEAAVDLTGADPTAEGVAAFFSRESTQASTHLAVDRDSCVRMLPDLVIPWGAKGANSDGLHVEVCGRAGWTRFQWMLPVVRPMLERTAYKTAKWCWQYKIPARWLTVRQVRGRRAKGITTHVDVNAAFRGGDHWDPGTGFPRDEFLSLVRVYLAEIERERKRA